MSSAAPGTSLAAAYALMAAEIAPLGAEQIAIADAAGRMLARPIRARRDAPALPLSTRDGYAVRRDEAADGQWLRLHGGELVPGGAPPAPLPARSAQRIFTGAAVPPGADSIIMQEYAERDERGARVRFRPGHGPERHIRAAASDFRAGEVLLDAGVRLGPRQLVVAAAADVGSLMVAPRPRVALISTGSELHPPGAMDADANAAAPFLGVADSIGLALAAMIAQAGGDVTDQLLAPDDLPRLESMAARLCGAADVVVVAGGASVGAHDHAKAMFAPLGLAMHFSGLPIRPGRPVWLGHVAGDGRAKDGRSSTTGSWVLGLPGNPTSAMVTARLLLVPLLTLLQGGRMADVLRWRRLPLAAPLPANGAREAYVRARWQDGGADGHPDGAANAALIPLADQESGSQAVLAGADWLIRCPPHQPALPAGSLVAALDF